jgi:hypothetical protein
VNTRRRVIRRPRRGMITKPPQLHVHTFGQLTVGVATSQVKRAEISLHCLGVAVASRIASSGPSQRRQRLLAQTPGRGTSGLKDSAVVLGRAHWLPALSGAAMPLGEWGGWLAPPLASPV